MKAKPLPSDYAAEGYEAGLVIPDTHFDERNGEIITVDHDAFNAVMSYAASHRWDWWVQLGDLGDWNVISSHNKNNLKAVEGQTIKRSADACNAGLDCIQTNVRRKAKDPLSAEVLITGNHCARLRVWSNAQPNLEGLLDYPTLMRVQERGLTYVDYWDKHEIWTRGEANFGHGHYLGPTGPARHLRDYGFNFIYGHDHSVNMSPLKTHGKGTRMAITMGCLETVNPGWLRGKPNQWQNAFGTIYVRKEDGMFNLYPSLIFDGQFFGPDGHVYDGRQGKFSSRSFAALPRTLIKARS
jgi:hypothetical protein